MSVRQNVSTRQLKNTKGGMVTKRLGELYQTADWKAEKHVPVIECADSVAADEVFEVKVFLGKEVAHPNTTEHHIRRIQPYFRPEGENFACSSGISSLPPMGKPWKDRIKGPCIPTAQ
jgi:desulfoferrodoxin (superoxide reductase-like protein)